MKDHLTLFKKIKEVISEQLNVPSSDIDLCSEPSNFIGWDSLANTMIYLELAKYIDEKLSFEEYLKCRNIGDVIDAILMTSKDINQNQ